MSEMDTEQEKKGGGKGKLFALLAGIGAIFAVLMFWRRRGGADDDEDEDDDL